MNSWPDSKAWRTLKMLGKTERPDLLLPGPVALRVNGLLKISPTLQPLLSLFLSLSIVPLRCFNQVHCQIIRRRGGVFPFHFLEGASQILAHSGLWELLSKSIINPPQSHFSPLFSLSLLRFAQAYLLPAEFPVHCHMFCFPLPLSPSRFWCRHFIHTSH